MIVLELSENRWRKGALERLLAKPPGLCNRSNPPSLQASYSPCPGLLRKGHMGLLPTQSQLLENRGLYIPQQFRGGRAERLGVLQDSEGPRSFCTFGSVMERSPVMTGRVLLLQPSPSELPQARHMMALFCRLNPGLCTSRQVPCTELHLQPRDIYLNYYYL